MELEGCRKLTFSALSRSLCNLCNSGLWAKGINPVDRDVYASDIQHMLANIVPQIFFVKKLISERDLDIARLQKIDSWESIVFY